MTTRKLTALLGLSTIVVTTGCIPVPSPTTTSTALALFDKDNDTQARVAIDGVVTVVLTENSGSTGCSWQHIPANDLVLDPLINGVKPGTGIGAPGQAVFVFAAKTVGVTNLRIEKTCPDNTKTQYRVEVTVMPGGM